VNVRAPHAVVPAKAGTQLFDEAKSESWIPAFAGMTKAKQEFCHAFHS
jgi:hypothetical protein